eukprot:14793084-Alexandrium_andersonii.AAC.1
MSASLVGSEMCIRDRRNTPRRARGPEGGRDVAGEDLARAVENDNEGAVSYTHLTLPTICSV